MKEELIYETARLLHLASDVLDPAFLELLLHYVYVLRALEREMIGPGVNFSMTGSFTSRGLQKVNANAVIEEPHAVEIEGSGPLDLHKA